MGEIPKEKGAVRDIQLQQGTNNSYQTENKNKESLKIESEGNTALLTQMTEAQKADMRSKGLTPLNYKKFILNNNGLIYTK